MEYAPKLVSQNILKVNLNIKHPKSPNLRMEKDIFPRQGNRFHFSSGFYVVALQVHQVRGTRSDNPILIWLDMHGHDIRNYSITWGR